MTPQRKAARISEAELIEIEHALEGQLTLRSMADDLSKLENDADDLAYLAKSILDRVGWLRNLPIEDMRRLIDLARSQP
jgi:hypothetical protein